MKLQIIYDSETSSSFEHAQRIQSEVNQLITDGSVSNDLSSSLEQGNSNEFKVFFDKILLKSLKYSIRWSIFS